MADKPLGNLFVRVAADVANFTKGMSRVEDKSKKAKGSLTDLGRSARNLTAIFGGVAVGALVKNTLSLGLAADETASKFRIVFGDAADSMQEFVDSFANAAGLTTAASQDILANAANIAKGLGLSADASADLAQQVTLLAGDLAAFNNQDTAEVARAITSALTGEREQMKRLGVVIRQADVDSLALAASGKLLVSELSEAEKVAATMQLAIERSGAAIGNLAETNMEATGQLKTMLAQMKDAQTVIGTAFIPAINLALTVVRALVEDIQKLGSSFALLWQTLKTTTARLFRTGDALEESEQRLRDVATANREVIQEIEGLNTELPVLNTNFQAVTETLVRLVPTTREFNLGVLTMGRVVSDALPPIQQLDRDLITAAISAHIQADAMDRAAAATQKAVDIIRTSTQASAGLFEIWRSNQSFFKKLGSTLQLAGGIVSLFPGGQLIGAGLIGAGTLAGQFAGGGQIPAGQVGLVGEEGPEMISGPATVTPMGGGAGDIVINIVTESGRKLVDTIRVKDKRDQDMRRVVRIPLAAVATG